MQELKDIALYLVNSVLLQVQHNVFLVSLILTLQITFFIQHKVLVFKFVHKIFIKMKQQINAFVAILSNA